MIPAGGQKTDTQDGNNGTNDLALDRDGVDIAISTVVRVTTAHHMAWGMLAKASGCASYSA